MSVTQGLNHLGLAVADLEATTAFFVDVLAWQEVGRDPSYPRTAVTDGQLRLTLWQVDAQLAVQRFDRRKNVGLHHLALQIATLEELHALHQRLLEVRDVQIEFAPEPLGDGPRQHMMCTEPSGIRLEFIWPGH